MAIKRDLILFVHFLIWTLLYVVICGGQNSGDVPDLKTTETVSTPISKLDLPAPIVESDQLSTATSTPTTKKQLSSTTSSAESTNETSSSTRTPAESTEKQLNSTTSSAETTKKQLGSTTSSAETTTKQTSSTSSSAESTKKQQTERTIFTEKVTTTKESITEDTALLTTLNGYRIATFCLAILLGVVFLIILIYFSTKSKTGHADISHPPNTPPLDPEDFPSDDHPKVVRLSSYFPHAENTLPKLPQNDAYGGDDDDDRKVSSFLTRRKSMENGSQDKILHTSDL